MSKLLFDSQPLIIIPELATKIGLNESIVLQQIHYWLEINTKARINFHDGVTWTYNTKEEWTKQFPFWSKSTVERTLASLVKTSLVKTGNYNKKGYDRTLWYTIDYKKLKEIENEIEAEKSHEHSSPQNDVMEQSVENTHNVKLKSSLPQNEVMDNSKLTLSPPQNDVMDNIKLKSPIPETNTKTTTKTKTEKKKPLSPSMPIDKFLDSIKSEMTEVSFKTWIEPLEIKEDKNKIIVVAPDETRKGIVKDRYLDSIQIHLKKYYKFNNLEVISLEQFKG